MASNAETQIRFMRLPAVKEATGLGESSIYQLVAEGKFPKPVPLVGRRSAWIESEIAEWQRARIAERDRRKKTSGAEAKAETAS